MALNLYVRPTLPPPDQGGFDAQEVFKDWAERVALALDDYSRHPDNPDIAWDLIALWAFSKRMDPKGCSENEELNSILTNRGKELIEYALDLPDPSSWLKSCEVILDEPEQNRSYLVGWLRELDEAELIAWAARELEVPDGDLEEDLSACEAWLTKNASAWLGAASYIRAVGESLRPDLPEHNPELALTALKWITLLDAWEEALETLAYRNVSPLLGEELRSFLSEATGVPILKRRRLTKISMSPFIRSASLAASSESDVSEVPSRQFEVPELGCWLVILGLPKGRLGVEIYDDAGDPSSALTGCAFIDPRGKILGEVSGSELELPIAAEDYFEIHRDDEILELLPKDSD
jgi:hypothetical protein